MLKLGFAIFNFLFLPPPSGAFDINRIADLPFCESKNASFEFCRTSCGKGLEPALLEAGLEGKEIDAAVKEVGRILDLNEENNEDGVSWWKGEGLFIDKLDLREGGKALAVVFEVKAASWTMALFAIDHSHGKAALGNFLKHGSKYDFSPLSPVEVGNSLFITIGSSNGGTGVAEHQLAFYRLDQAKLSLELAVPTKGERKGWNPNCDVSYEATELCPELAGGKAGIGMSMRISYPAPSCATGKEPGEDQGETPLLLQDDVKFFFELNEKGGLSFEKSKSSARFAPKEQIYHCSDPHEFIVTHFKKFEVIAKGRDKAAIKWLKCLIGSAKASGPADGKIARLKSLLDMM